MYKVEKFQLFKPSLQDIAKVLQDGLITTFSEVDVQVVDCPNLQHKPFMLAAEGLCGTPCIADVGGPEYLLPLAQNNKIYSFKEISKNVGLPNAFIIGAGAGDRPHVGVNCEMMANLRLGDESNIQTHVAKIKDGVCELVHLKDSTDFCLLGNLFISEGKPGKVIKVVAKNRIGPKNFISAIRLALDEKYEDPVGMGGVFIIREGKARLHIMQDYSGIPINTEEDLNNWLKFFEFPAPLSCLSTFVSKDPGLNIRVEHTHCFSDHGVGGHYHEDTTAESVEYEAYFNVADILYRIDQPAEVLKFGKD
ncbi:hypothetical protein JTE90_012810 [Oedothorax gibbosus]|uniref:DUF1907 domain-containing protein n=1 Tax=Oedothorax gibbosus TaxID=931172 RepID=A0AAV6W2V3_9ARAC|nr:hypothetical protein JTE90_012810 [Oedothorax gibbosus]